LSALLACRCRRARLLEGSTDLLYGIGRCLALLGGLPEILVWDREGALHAGGGDPTKPFATFCGQLRLAGSFLSRDGCARNQGRLGSASIPVER
jgi:hypothetical protein